MLTPGERAQLADFLVKLIDGRADLGFSSLGLLDLYKRAKAEPGINFLSMLLEHPEMAKRVARAVAKNLKHLGPTVVSELELAIQQAKGGAR